jgi:hypothetical protein
MKYTVRIPARVEFIGIEDHVARSIDLEVEAFSRDDAVARLTTALRAIIDDQRRAQAEAEHEGLDKKG